MIKRISKAIAGGLGAAVARTIILFLPEMSPDQQQAVEYIIYTVLTGFAVYIAPANQS